MRRRPRLVSGGMVFATILAGLSWGGCGDSNSEAIAGWGFSEPFDCGPSSCSAEQICLTTEPSPFTPEAATTYDCVAPPSGCDASSLCDCDYPDPYQGKAVTACSVMSERTLYLTDVSCGGSPCGADQVCVVEAASGEAVTPATPAACVNLPPGCTRSIDFCSTTCPDQITTATGGSRTGCLGADWAVAIWITPS